MKQSCTVTHQELLKILAAMLPICTKRTAVDATASLCIQIRQREMIIKSTDLEVALQASCTLEESSFDHETLTTFLVPGKRLHDIVKELEGTIEWLLTPGLLTLRSNGVVVQLNIAESSQFPPFPERIENLMHIETALLTELLRGVSFVIPQQHASHALTGLLWESGPGGTTLTGTDGHCLAQSFSPKCTLKEPQQWLVPKRAALELQKLLELMPEPMIFIGTCGKHVVFSGELFNFFTRLLVGQYPHYSAIMDHSDFASVTIERHQLVKTLRRSASLLSGQFIATEFTFKPAVLDVALQNKEVGSLHEQVPTESYTGAPIALSCYAPYILQGLHVFSEEQTLQLRVKSSVLPLVFVAERAAHATRMTYLVMPVARAATPHQ